MQLNVCCLQMHYIMSNRAQHVVAPYTNRLHLGVVCRRTAATCSAAALPEQWPLRKHMSLLLYSTLGPKQACSHRSIFTAATMMLSKCAVSHTGLEELLMASAAAEAVDPDLPLEAQPVNVLPSVLAGSLQDKPSSSPTPLVVGVATQQAAAQAVQQRAAETTARQAAGTLPEPALRPAPFIPDFVLNPGLEAVEENYSSSDYSEEESTA